MTTIEIGKLAYEEAVKMGADGPLMQDTSEAGKLNAYKTLGEILEQTNKWIDTSIEQISICAYNVYTSLGVCKETDAIIRKAIDSARIEAIMKEHEQEEEDAKKQ